MDTVENTFPIIADRRYQYTLKQYKKALRKDATLSFLTFCRTMHVNYDGIKEWIMARGVSIEALKREATEGVWTSCRQSSSGSSPEPTFVQFQPRLSQKSAMIGNVSITFPDGVNLTLQESGVDEVMSLLDAYRSRHQAEGGAEQCSR